MKGIKEAFIDAGEISQMLGIGMTKAYAIIKEYNAELEAAWHAASEDMAKAAQAGPQPGAQGPFNGGQAGPQGADDQGVDEQ